MTITDLLGICPNDIAAIVGCGGKTSLIRLLACQNKEKKVLVSPTTQMLPMPPEEATLCVDLDACIAHKPQKGIQQMGLRDERTGKLRSLPQDVLRRMAGEYDLTLLEADGSAGKPMKGWKEYEPVIPSFCTLTVGVCSIAAIGLPFTAENIHRPKEFARLTGLKEGDIVGVHALADMLCSENGMFWNAKGKLALVVNQAEGEQREQQAQHLLKLVHGKQPHRFASLVYGSIHKNIWKQYVMI